jgi:hypothetical protein
LKDIDEWCDFELQSSYKNEEECYKQLELYFHLLKGTIRKIQDEMIDFVDYVFNTNKREDIKGYTQINVLQYI